MAGGTMIPIAIGRGGGAVVIKPVGRCTLVICPRLHDYLKTLCAPEVSHLYFDLSESDGVDSTFTGFLIALAAPKGESNGPAVHLVGPSPTTREALRNMHVLPLFDLCANIPTGPLEWDHLRPAPASAESTGELVIAAHEQLIRADARNATAFGRLVETLRQDQVRHAPALPACGEP